MATADEITAEIAAVQSILSAIGHDITGVINNALVNLVAGAKGILNFIHDRITDMYNLLQGIGNAVKDSIGNAIGAIVPAATDFLTSAISAIGANVSSILGNLATAEEFVASAINE